MMILDAWTTGQLQNAAAMMQMALEQHLALHDLLEKVEEVIASRTAPSIASPNKKSITCEQCGSTMAIYPVNISRCTRVDGGWSSVIVCRECGREMYSRLTPAQIVAGW